MPISALGSYKEKLFCRKSGIPLAILPDGDAGFFCLHKQGRWFSFLDSASVYFETIGCRELKKDRGQGFIIGGISI